MIVHRSRRFCTVGLFDGKRQTSAAVQRLPKIFIFWRNALSRLLLVTTLSGSRLLSDSVSGSGISPSTRLPKVPRVSPYASMSGSSSEHGSDFPQVCPDGSIGNSPGIDRLICLECGFATRRLRPHLTSKHMITPAQYRARWHLPSDYPMAIHPQDF